ncbi:mucin-22-like [Puntigrus tetrazona]|uniref:mucin-22-like n=1 Tax=Puntigrus tetrazona TaxID=1606681 RepID=UPI001C89B2AD|nr:mucin-22-like [Puntigrus tetrazona]
MSCVQQTFKKDVRKRRQGPFDSIWEYDLIPTVPFKPEGATISAPIQISIHPQISASEFVVPSIVTTTPFDSPHNPRLDDGLHIDFGYFEDNVNPTVSIKPLKLTLGAVQTVEMQPNSGRQSSKTDESITATVGSDFGPLDFDGISTAPCGEFEKTSKTTQRILASSTSTFPDPTTWTNTHPFRPPEMPLGTIQKAETFSTATQSSGITKMVTSVVDAEFGTDFGLSELFDVKPTVPCGETEETPKHSQTKLPSSTPLYPHSTSWTNANPFIQQDVTPGTTEKRESLSGVAQPGGITKIATPAVDVEFGTDFGLSELFDVKPTIPCGETEETPKEHSQTKLPYSTPLYPHPTSRTNMDHFRPLDVTFGTTKGEYTSASTPDGITKMTPVVDANVEFYTDFGLSDFDVKPTIPYEEPLKTTQRTLTSSTPIHLHPTSWTNTDAFVPLDMILGTTKIGQSSSAATQPQGIIKTASPAFADVEIGKDFDLSGFNVKPTVPCGESEETLTTQRAIPSSTPIYLHPTSRTNIFSPPDTSLGTTKGESSAATQPDRITKTPVVDADVEFWTHLGFSDFDVKPTIPYGEFGETLKTAQSTLPFITPIYPQPNSWTNTHLFSPPDINLSTTKGEFSSAATQPQGFTKPTSPTLADVEFGTDFDISDFDIKPTVPCGELENSPKTTLRAISSTPTQTALTTLKSTRHSAETVTAGFSSATSTSVGATSVESTTQGTPSVESTTQGTPSVESTTQGTPSVESTTQGTPSVESTTQGTTSVKTTTLGTTYIASTTQGVTPTETTSLGTTSGESTSQGATSVESTTLGTGSTETTSLGTTSVESTTQGATSVESTTLGTTPVASTTQGATSVESTTQGATSVESTTLGTIPVASTTQGATSVESTTQGTTSVESTTLGTGSTESTSLGTTSVESTTQGATSVESTTLGTTPVATTTQGTSTVESTTLGITSSEATTQGITSSKATTIDTSVVETVTLGTPTVESTTLGITSSKATTIGTSTVESTTQGITSSEATTQGTTSSEAATIGTSTVETTTLGTTTSEATTHGTTTSEATTHGTTSSQATTLGTTSSQATTLGTTSSQATTLGTTSSQATTLGTTSSQATTLGTTSSQATTLGTTSSQATTLGTTSSQATTLGTTSSQATTLGTTSSQATTLGTTSSQATTLGTTSSQATTLGTTSSQATTLGTTSSQATTLGTTSSQATTHGTTFSEATTLGTTFSEATTPGTTFSEATTPGITSSEATTLGITSSEATTLGITSSEATTLGITSSEATTLGITSSEATTLGITSSEATTHGTTFSEATTLGTTFSEATTLGTTFSEATTLGTTSHYPGNLYCGKYNFGHYFF